MKKKSIIVLFFIIIAIFSINNKVFAVTRKGWQQKNGKWYYFNYSNSSRYTNGQYQIDGKYYWFDEKGVMIPKDWYQDKRYYHTNNWYYITSSGACAIGWKEIDGKWYYFNSDGTMIENVSRTINRSIYVFDKSGAMVEKTGWYQLKQTWGNYWYYLKGGGSKNKAVVGWKKLGKTWYYLSEYDGSMYDFPALIKNGKGVYKLYCFDNSGKWIEKPKGWYKKVFNDGDYWYYFEGTYGVCSSWKKIGGIWYYFGEGGQMYNSPDWVKNKIEYFEPSGKWVEKLTKGWNKIGGEWYYYKNGKFSTGWQFIGNVWYYFDSYGKMYKNQVYYDNSNDVYYFDNSGAMVTNYWRKSEQSYTDGMTGKSYKYYIWEHYDKDGIRENLLGWHKIDNSWYYYSSSNWIYYNGAHEIGGDYYVFGKDGKMLSNGWHSANGSLWNEVTQSYEYNKTVYYYLDDQGRALTNEWITENGKKYYVDYEGKREQNRCRSITDSSGNYDYYAFDKNGVMITNDFYKEEYNSYDEFGDITEKNVDYHYLGSDGKAYKKEWLKGYNGYDYYFDYGCDMVVNDVCEIYDDSGNYKYAFDENGHMVKNDWFEYTYYQWDEDKEEDVKVKKWVYLGSDGKAYKEKWLKGYNGYDYYFDSNCNMVVNDVREIRDDNGNYYKYAFDENGHIVKNSWFGYDYYQWDEDKNENVKVKKWVYLDSDGKSYKGKWLKGYNGYDYYFDSSCNMVASETCNTKEGIFAFDKDGHKITKVGLVELKGYHDYDNKITSVYAYVKNTNGDLKIEEWYSKGVEKYYFDYNGRMCINKVVWVNDDTYGLYAFDEEGRMLKNCWYLYKDAEWDEYIQEYVDKKMYLKADGEACRGEWLDLSGDRYYFDYNGYMVTGNYEIDGVTYEFGDDGKLIKGKSIINEAPVEIPNTVEESVPSIQSNETVENNEVIENDENIEEPETQDNSIQEFENVIDNTVIDSNNIDDLKEEENQVVEKEDNLNTIENENKVENVIDEEINENIESNND